MLRDVFYYGTKPNVHPREKPATSLLDACNQSTTEHFWVVNEFCDYSNFDWEWDFEFLPDGDVWAEAHNNVWPSLHQKDSGTWLCNSVHSDITIYRADVSPIPRKNEINLHWHILVDIDKAKFDFSWHPDPLDPPYIYVWGNFYVPGTIASTVEYHVEGATDKKFMQGFVAILPETDRWSRLETLSSTDQFDLTWRPNPTSPPYIYQFGTILNREDGPRYTVPENDGEIVYLERDRVHNVAAFEKYYIYTTLEDLIHEHPNEVFWALNPDLSYLDFDFDWKPDMDKVQYVHAFGSKDNINTQTYFVNAVQWLKGFKDINYVEDKKLEVRTKMDMFFVDRSNPESSARFEQLKVKFPNIQKTRYLNSWAETIKRCVNKATGNMCWILNSELDYTDFNFDYYPDPWQMKMVHVFGTQWSSWGTTFLVNCETFAEDTKYIKVVEHLKNLNFVKSRIAVATNCLYDVYVIDHGNKEMWDIVSAIKPKISDKSIVIVPYQNSYLETFNKLIRSLPDKKEQYIWICSSVCDYDTFDFTYICDPFAKEQLHVFPSDRQKFGDTFLVNVTRFKEMLDEMSQLEDYKIINYNKHQRVPRLPAPVIMSDVDSHVTTVLSATFDFPYAVFVSEDNKDISVPNYEPMSLWSPEKKTIISTSEGGTRIVVPKETKSLIDSQLYDYPYITKLASPTKSKPLDIVFLSNGEVGADENYEHLLKVTKGLGNRIIRVSDVNGRINAYHAAARASNTPWMFTVFAKLEVSANFDWDWQPDRLQMAKHYIFHAFNPVNELEYGHQAIIAYNKNVTLANKGSGLDFTLDSPHEVVEMLSGVAKFNTDPFSTWRTAFREAIKLRNDPADISQERLNAWLTKATGPFSEFSLGGAKNGVDYYETVNGDMTLLRLSYDWEWLRSRFNRL